MKSKDLIDRAIENICEDRDRLVVVYETIEKVAKTSGDDVLAIAAVSEHFVKIADSLTKQNSQLIDLAKLKSKIESESKSQSADAMGDFDDDETNDIYTSIESSSN